MIEHRCSVGERGGFFQRLRTGTYPGHILEHVTLELQSLAGLEVGFGRARETSEQGVYRVVVEYKEEDGCQGMPGCRARVDPCGDSRSAPSTRRPRFSDLRDMAHEICLGPSTNAIVEAAVARGIPVRRLNDCSLVQLGYGARQRRIQAAETDRTSAIAEQIAQDKELTRLLLRSVGIPVADGRPVSSADDAWEAACDIGLPVVVKPRDGNQGRGVATNLTSRDQVVKAYEAALLESPSVMVEKYALGHDYRVLVVGGRVVAAARREPAHVLGDGTHTVSELVDLANLDPRRGEHHATVLSKIKLDAVALAVLNDQNLTPESVPAGGAMVLIRRNGNLSTGGTAIDVTERVHPHVAARAVEAVQVIGLDVAGIDVITADISAPLEEQGGIIVRGQCGPRPPNALAALGRHLPTGGRGNHFHDVPGWPGRADTDRRRHGRQRQDHHGPLHRPHPPWPGPEGGHDVYRRNLHRQPPGRHRRLQRSAKREGHPAQPDRRGRRLRDRPRWSPS